LVIRSAARTRVATVSLSIAFAFIVIALAPDAAFGHAVLKSTDPSAGTTVKREPSAIGFRFNEPVEGNFGGIQVYDRRGEQVQSGDPFHPGGRGSALATKLRSGLPKGTYTATYRVISADGHPVSGGLVFSIGKAGLPGATVSQLLSRRHTAGAVTQVAFGVVRGLQYAAIATGIGSVFFLLVIWLPALAAVAGGSNEWRLASERFASRLRAVLLVALAVAVVSGALGIVLQGATAAGTSFWSALDPATIREVLGTRFGTVWALRIAVWLGFGAVLLATLSARRRPVLRPASVGATGLALSRGGVGPVSLFLLAIPLGFLAISPALAGHASLQHPTGVLFPANVIHVIAVSVWVAGLLLLLAVVPAATRALAAPDRTRLLATTLARFSTVAGIAVGVLLVTGLVQSYIEIRSVNHLFDTAFGRAALIKFALLIGPLVALGAYNRRRIVPALRRIAAGGEPPGRAGVLLRRSLRLEVALIVVVLGVTSALVSYPPSIAVSSGGPFATTKSLGPADMQLTVDPAKIGPNQMHVYLTDKRTGSQFDRVKEFRVSLTQPKKGIGPLKADARKGGPGHYVIGGAVFGVAGDWRVDIEARVSDFDAYYSTVDVPIK
jgi:copper transport protein